MKQKKNLIFAFVTLILLATLLIGCSTGDSVSAGGSDIYPGKLIGYELLKTYGIDEINQALKQYYAPAGLDISDLLKTTVPLKAYSLEYYTTNIDGQLIKVSGLTAIPTAPGETFPLVQYQHGSQFNNSQVPSNIEQCPEALLACAVFAGHGYVTSFPDYIGQGKSKALQTYMIADSTATTCADMLKATGQLCEKLNVRLSGKLFLCGASQGGNATLSLQNYLENQQATDREFTLTAVAPIAPPCDLPACWSYWNRNNPAGCSAVISRMITTYRTVYQWEIPLDSIFRPPFDTTIAEIDDGTNNMEEVTKLLPKKLCDLLQERFIMEVDSAGHPFHGEMKANSAYEFTPSTSTTIYHSVGDVLVPISVSETALKYWHGKGAGNVRLERIDSAFSHSETFLPATILMKKWFDRMK